jgi:hypothetical protein
LNLAPIRRSIEALICRFGRRAWKSRAPLLQGGLGFPWSLNGDAFASPQPPLEPIVAKPIVQDNNPRKTKFTFEEAVDVWLRRWNGQDQHEIAAAYVINPRAVNHVLNEVTHVGSKEEAARRIGRTG